MDPLRMDPGFHGSLKTARPYTPLSDAERFEALTAGLEAASLHHVARHVREQRAELSIPSHAMYTQRLLAGRGDAFAPIYVTSPSMNGARRSTLNSVHAMPSSATSSVKKSPATYSSPNLLRQFAEPTQAPTRPATASREATAAAWRAPFDASANQRSYEHHRAAGRGWPVAPPKAPEGAEMLDVAAEQAAAATAAAAADMASSGGTYGLMPPPTSPPMPNAGQALARSTPEQETTPPAAPALPKPAPSLGGRSSRRALDMADAAHYYTSRSHAAALLGAPPTPPPPVQMSIARARARQANQSDIFGHQTDGRGHADLLPGFSPRR
jgi:hypothetical protein